MRPHNRPYLFLHKGAHWEPIDLQDSVSDMDGIPHLWTNKHAPDPGDNRHPKNVNMCLQGHQVW